MLDQYKRRIHYLRISVTDRCNLRCVYCMPEEGVQMKSHHNILSYERIVDVAREAVKLGIDKVRLTGGEPLVRKGICDLVEQLKKIPGIADLSLTTNGVLLPHMAEELKMAGLDRLNVSLDTLNGEKYKRLTRVGDLSHVLRGIAAAKRSGFKGTKLNMVIIPGINDDEVEAMKLFCRQQGLVLQRINHYSLDRLDSINREYEAERPLACSCCNRIRLTADGKIKPCLFSDIEYKVDFSDLETSLKRAIMSKPQQGVACQSRENWQIGG